MCWDLLMETFSQLWDIVDLLELNQEAEMLIQENSVCRAMEKICNIKFHRLQL